MILTRDFILQVKSDLQEKSEHWTVDDLLIKLQRAYISLQSDLPYFMGIEMIPIEKGKVEYRLDKIFLKHVSFVIDGAAYDYDDIENIYTSTISQNIYSYHNGNIFLNKLPQKDLSAKIAYKYEKKLKNANCYIEIPSNWHEALRLLFMSKIQEKPTRNTKERNLSKHYLDLYRAEINDLRKTKKAITKNVTSKYQRV